MIRKVLEWIYTPFVMLLMGLMTLVGMFLAIAAAYGPKKNIPLQSWVPRTWSRNMFRLFWPRLRVEGLEYYDAKKPCIIVSNHQSLLDIPALYTVLAGHLRMVAKAELFRIPVFGAAITAIGQVSVDRTDRKSAQASVMAVSKHLSNGLQIWLAPEGTRSRDGQLGPFKSGAFRMALEAKVPLLPIIIDGTKDMLPKGTLRVGVGQKVLIKILPPIPYEELLAKGYRQVKEETFQKMQNALLASRS